MYIMALRELPLEENVAVRSCEKWAMVEGMQQDIFNLDDLIPIMVESEANA